MQKPKFVAALLSALLITALAGTLLVNMGKAQVVFILPDPSTYCRVPQTPTLKTSIEHEYFFSTRNVTILATLTMSWGDYSVSPIQYYVDEKLLGEIPGFEFTPVIVPPPTNNIYKSFSFKLTGLSEGSHRLDVVVPNISWKSGDWVENQLWPYGYGTNFALGGQTYGGPGYDYPDLTAEFGSIHLVQYFYVNIPYVDTTPPRITILTTQNKTYDSRDFLLPFTINESVSWIGYSLDGKGNITITDDVNQTSISLGKNQIGTIETTTLRELSDGVHSLTLYATDPTGNIGESEPLYFTTRQEVQIQSSPETVTLPQEAEPFPTTLAIAVLVVSLIVISTGLLVYFKKRKH